MKLDVKQDAHLFKIKPTMELLMFILEKSDSVLDKDWEISISYNNGQDTVPFNLKKDLILTETEYTRLIDLFNKEYKTKFDKLLNE
jgi:hypothetical protein